MSGAFGLMMASMPTAAPWRDPRYAADTVAWTARSDGGGVLANPAPIGRVFSTAAAPLEHWAAEDGARTWLAERSGAGWRRLSYAEAAGRIAALATGLARLGLEPGRPLMLLARNGIDTALVTYAAMRAGIAAAPVTPQYALPGAELSRLRHALTLLGPGAVYVDDAHAFADALAAAPLAPGVAVIGPADLERLSVGPSAPDRAVPGEVAKLLLTSGSTGAPKAVALSHANLAINAAQVAACYDDPDPPVMVNSAPWSHSLGAHAILHMAAHRGGALFIDAGQPTAARFGETLRNLAEVETTYLNMVPAGWALLADALERDRRGDGALGRTVFARLRVMQYGGAGLPADVLRRVGEAAVRACGERVTFAAGYGVTETTPTVSNVRWPNDRSGLLGSPIPGTEIKLAPVGGGKLEVRIRGPQVALGYRGADGEVAPLPLDADGFYATGDAGRLAEPERPERGIVFDGRLVENFKLATGAFVAAGGLRLAALSALGGLATEAVVCGEGQAGVGLLLFANAGACAGLDAGAPHASAAVREAARARLLALNGAGAATGGRIARALVLEGAPDAASGELTDKGYLNQALARARRPAELARLFAAEPDAAVIVL